jgi:hypothetical protein
MTKINIYSAAGLLAVVILFFACSSQQPSSDGLKFALSFSSEMSQSALDGRMLLMISNDESREPRFQITRGPSSQLVFGVDVNGLQPGEEVMIGKEVFGYPLTSIAEIPAGEYHVQGLLNRYETFERADGHTVKLPPDKGEGQQWSRKPGNFYSTPMTARIDPKKDNIIKISLDQKIPDITPVEETEYIKYVKIQSDLLSEFWGRPMYLGAWVLLPEGFDEHPEARYPLIINHGHFPRQFGGFRTEPPDPDLEPDFSERFDWPGYNITQQEYAYKFYQYWRASDTPRMVIIKVQHANPYYDDSYAVNSENLGPYGDAITYELIPHIEEKFRCIGEGWARFLYGGSTGGWEALGVQVFYPDEYNGCFAACPDPIDFRAYTSVNIYEDKNAYYLDTPWKKTPRPRGRNTIGEVQFTLREACHLELVLGTNNRSGGQQDIWEAVFGPAGKDGFPQRIWDRKTGEIDPDAAEYWRENYDLRYILERDWAALGPKLKGKIHIYTGDMDDYYLNNAVYLMEEFLENTKNPYYDGEIDYGDRAGHCWNGDQTRPNALSRLRYHQMFIPKILNRIQESAPPGADTSSWRY